MREKGSILILTIFVLALVFLFVALVVSQKTSDLQISSIHKSETRALYLARAGMEREIYDVEKYQNTWLWETPPGVGGPGTDGGSIITACGSGSSTGHVWGTKVSYPQNAAWSLYFIPPQTLQGSPLVFNSAGTLSFCLWTSFASGDGVFLQYSTDGGANWTSISSGLTPAYNGTLGMGNPWGTVNAYTGATAGWTHVTWTPPPALNGTDLLLAFRFGSVPGSAGGPGAFIDNLNYPYSLVGAGTTGTLGDDLESGPAYWAQILEPFPIAPSVYQALYWAPPGGSPTIRARGYDRTSASGTDQTLSSRAVEAQVAVMQNGTVFSVKILSLKEF